MDNKMKSNIVAVFATLVFLAAVIIASAGAINYGFKASEHVFTVAGVLNLIAGGWSIAKVVKAQNTPKK